MSGVSVIEISKGHPDFTMIANTAGVYSTILEGKTPPGVSWLVGDTGQITGNIVPGEVPGIPLFVRLLDAAGTELPDDTMILFGSQKPFEETVSQIGNPISYRIFRRLTDGEQFNVDTRNTRLIYTGRNIVGLRTDTKLILQIKSSAVIDPATSEVMFEIVEAV